MQVPGRGFYLQSALPSSRPPCKYLESAFYLQSALPSSRPPCKYLEREFYLASGGQDWPPLDKSNSFSGCLSDRGAQPLAELSLAERSEAPARSAVPREARPAPKAPGAEGAPEPREGRQAKLGCDSTAATQLPRLNCLGRRESVLCTYGI